MIGRKTIKALYIMNNLLCVENPVLKVSHRVFNNIYNEKSCSIQGVD